MPDILNALGGAAKFAGRALGSLTYGDQQQLRQERLQQQQMKLQEQKLLLEEVGRNPVLLTNRDIAKSYDRAVGQPGAHERVLLGEASKRGLLGAEPIQMQTGESPGVRTVFGPPTMSEKVAQASQTQPLKPGSSVSGQVDGVTRSRSGVSHEQGAEVDFGAVLQKGLDTLGTSADDPEAVQFLTKRIVAQAQREGRLVPAWAQKVTQAKTDRAIQAALAGATESARQSVQLQYTGPKEEAKQAAQLKFAGTKAQAAEAGQRAARLDTPIAPEEWRTRNIFQASKVGGTTFGRKLSDDDLATAEASGHVLLQQPDGSYIGVPSTAVPEGSVALTPDELQTKRLAQNVATRRTTQLENAQIVMSALDHVDKLKAFDLLQPATPQGAGLGSKLLGAAKTELAGQTVGRATVWAARRSPDPAEREKAIALINLASLATSVVKAMGDVGAISEADKSLFLTRLGRLASGQASKEEGESQKAQLRSMMELIANAPATLTKGTPDAEATAQALHEMLTTSAPPAAPGGTTSTTLSPDVDALLREGGF